MINIKSTTWLAKRISNCIVIAITNCNQTASEQSFLFIQRRIGSCGKYPEAVQTHSITVWYFVKNTNKPCRILLDNTIYIAPWKTHCAFPDKVINVPTSGCITLSKTISANAFSPDRLLYTLPKCREWVNSLRCCTSHFLSHDSTIISLLKPNPLKFTWLEVDPPCK